MITFVMKSLYLIFLIYFSQNFSLINAECPNKKGLVVCYFASWGVYRPGTGQYQVENIDPNLCTHLIYTFAGLDLPGNTITSLDPWNDFAANGGKNSYKKFVDLKEKNPCLKVLLSVGGWNEKSTKYSIMAYKEESRKMFADQALRFIVQYEFDGLDFDWEYPALRGGINEDKNNYILLLQELKKAFEPWQLLLTVAVGPKQTNADKSYDIKKISETVDFIHLMAYDYVSAKSPKTGLLAPLKAKEGEILYTIDNDVQYWRRQGCNMSKMVLGIPLYARSFKLKSPENKDVGAETDENTLAGNYTKYIGTLSIYELYEIIFNEDGYDEFENNIYANNYATNGIYWFTYETEKTIKDKVKYAKDNGLAGVMAWSIDTDDFNGEWDEPYPLLRTMYESVQG